MSRLEEHSITIYDAVKNVESGKYIMPAFQRQFVWDMPRIEKLWDSILQGYPISTFLFWHVDENNSSSDTYFCEFMKEMRFDSGKKADSINYDLRNIDLSLSDTAVLDGQQRLTSLYITLLGQTGLRDKYAKKTTRGMTLTDLMIQLNKNKIDIQDEFNVQKYDIKFSSKLDLLEPTKFKIKKLFENDKFKNAATREAAIEEEIKFIPTDSKDYAREILNLLCVKIFEEPLIRYTEIFDMNQDDALEMFVRFNSGGISLKKSQITMAILEAYWPSAKHKFKDLLQGKFIGFDTDFILRTAHMLFGDVVKSNISKQVANDLKNNWDAVEKAILETADLFEAMKIDISRFANSWNVLIPVIFCVYFNPDYIDCLEGISAYIHRAIFFTYFQSGTTGKLQILKNNIISFNYQIRKEMLDSINDLHVSDAKIEDILLSEKGSRVAGEVLYYLSVDWVVSGVEYHQDHLHPEARFSQTPPTGITMVKWAEWRKLYNRLPNLQYLNWRGNESKNVMSLQQYFDDMSQDKQQEFIKNSFIPEGVSLDIGAFETFYTERKKLLAAAIKKLLQ